MVELESHSRLYAEFSRFFFQRVQWNLAVFIVKNPELHALIAASAASQKIEPPYPPGTCLLLPKSCGEKYEHVVISRMEEVSGHNMYFYEHAKPRASAVKYLQAGKDPGVIAKSTDWIEQHSIVFSSENPKEWLGHRDIGAEKVDIKTNARYPSIIAHTGAVQKARDYFARVLSEHGMADLMQIKDVSSKYSPFEIISPKQGLSGKSPNQIWVNQVPRFTSMGSHLVFLSPFYSCFQDRLDEINDLVSREKLSPPTDIDFPEELVALGLLNRSSHFLSVLAAS